MNEKIKPTMEGDHNVKAVCNECSAISMFILQNAYSHKNDPTTEHSWSLMKCSNCGAGGLAHFTTSNTGQYNQTRLRSFIPRGIHKTILPSNVPEGIKNEYEEAEKCFSASANRGASTLIRSVLEKTLKENGYASGNLKNKIDKASGDGIITASRKQKAHDDIRVIGNEIVDDAWRSVDDAEVLVGLHYAQRILEDFYDDRPSVEAILKIKNRLPLPLPKKTP